MIGGGSALGTDLGAASGPTPDAKAAETPHQAGFLPAAPTPNAFLDDSAEIVFRAATIGGIRGWCGGFGEFWAWCGAFGWISAWCGGSLLTEHDSRQAVGNRRKSRPVRGQSATFVFGEEVLAGFACGEAGPR